MALLWAIVVLYFLDVLCANLPISEGTVLPCVSVCLQQDACVCVCVCKLHKNFHLEQHILISFIIDKNTSKERCKQMVHSSVRDFSSNG